MRIQDLKAWRVVKDPSVAADMVKAELENLTSEGLIILKILDEFYTKRRVSKVLFNDIYRIVQRTLRNFNEARLTEELKYLIKENYVQWAGYYLLTSRAKAVLNYTKT